MTARDPRDRPAAAWVAELLASGAPDHRTVAVPTPGRNDDRSVVPGQRPRRGHTGDVTLRWSDGEATAGQLDVGTPTDRLPSRGTRHRTLLRRAGLAAAAVAILGGLLLTTRQVTRPADTTGDERAGPPAAGQPDLPTDGDGANLPPALDRFLDRLEQEVSRP